jgi:hypothetical protein
MYEMEIMKFEMKDICTPCITPKVISNPIGIRLRMRLCAIRMS